MIMEELSYSSKNKRQLNEIGMIAGLPLMVMIGAVGFATVSAADKILRKLKIGEYAEIEELIENDPELKQMMAQAGEMVTQGMSPEEAVRELARQDSRVADRIRAIENKYRSDTLGSSPYDRALGTTPSQQPGYRFDYDDL